AARRRPPPGPPGSGEISPHRAKSRKGKRQTRYGRDGLRRYRAAPPGATNPPPPATPPTELRPPRSSQPGGPEPLPHWSSRGRSNTSAERTSPTAGEWGRITGGGSPGRGCRGGKNPPPIPPGSYRRATAKPSGRPHTPPTTQQ